MRELPNCTRSISNTPIATIKLFGTRVTVTDNVRPTLKVGGALIAAGWHRATDRVTYDAADSTGIPPVGSTSPVRPSATLVLATTTSPRRARASRRGRSACPQASAWRHTRRAGGRHGRRGNESFAQREIRVDGTPPTASLVRAKGRLIVLSLRDTASGVASASLEVRNKSSEPYRSLSAKVDKGRLTAKLDRGRASRVDMRVTLRDVAGNVAQGAPTRLSATSAKFGRRVRKVRSGRVKVPFGRSARLRGRLTRSASEALAGQTVVATATVRRGGAPTKPAGSAVTDRRGRFSLRVPAGPSRTYRLAFNGGGGALGAARTVSVRVPASSTIHASRTRVSGRTRVRFSGRLRSRGQPIPGRGLVLVLQGRERDAGAPSRTPGPTAAADGTSTTRSAAGRGATRSASASGASRPFRSTSATRER